MNFKKLIFLVKLNLTKKQFVFLSAVLVGISVGLSVVVLKMFAHYIFLIATFDTKVNSRYLFVILPVLGLFLTVLVTRKVLKGKLTKGLSNIHEAIAKKSSIVPRSQMYSQILTSSLTVGLGGSAGLEAPIVITGAAFGSNYARTYRLNYKDRTLLLSCGIAAGIGAAFNAPIAGVLFALEVLLLDVSISAFIPLIIAAASGALVSEIILHEDILLTFKLTEVFQTINVPFYALLGVFCGLIAVYHSRVFLKVESLFSKSKKGVYQKMLVGGFVLATLILFFPSLYGEGYESIKSLSLLNPEKLLSNSIFQDFMQENWFILLFISILILIKPIATAVTLGSGGNGGNFAPSLFVGAHLGYVFSKIVNSYTFFKLPESNFTLVGMAGILSGIYHAPLTAIFLIAEITGGYTLMIPLMIVSSISYAISRYFEPFSMDTKEKASAGSIFTHDKDRNILSTLEINEIIDKSYEVIDPNLTFGAFIKKLSSSQRNVFPVVNPDGLLLGVVYLDEIREFMFKTELYNSLHVYDIMSPSIEIVSIQDSMEHVMAKFDQTGAWVLPVEDQGKFKGFILKSAVFSAYRLKLKDIVIE